MLTLRQRFTLNTGRLLCHRLTTPQRAVSRLIIVLHSACAITNYCQKGRCSLFTVAE